MSDGRIPNNNEEAPVFLGGCYSYRNSNYDGNHDWTSPVFSSRDHQITEQTAVTNDRLHSVGDLHLGTMEQNVKRYSFFLTIRIINIIQGSLVICRGCEMHTMENALNEHSTAEE
jgi:hypothetical protein